MEIKKNRETRETKFTKDDRGRVAKIAHSYGKNLFAGHEINWTQLGSTLWKQTKNYIRSWYDEDYAQIVRDEFFNYWAKTLENIQTEVQMEQHLHHLTKISDEDIPEIRKMELIIKAVGKKERFKNIRPPKENTAYLNKATDYFNNQKKIILQNMEAAFTENVNSVHKAALDTVKSTFDEDPKSRDDLETLKFNYAKALISKVIELMGTEIVNNEDTIDTIKTNLNKFVDDPAIGLLEKDKRELEAALDKQKLIYDMTQDEYLKQQETNEFLENPETKQITNYKDFESELYRQYPQTNPLNQERFKKLQKFKKITNELDIEDINSQIIKPSTANYSLEQTLTTTANVIKKRYSSIDDEALKLYILEVLGSMVLKENIKNIDDQKRFFEKNPEFKFILDSPQLGKLTTAIKDFKSPS